MSDAGAGIPAEIRDRLFDPFFTTKPGGSGLGLAVVHRAIEAHRGLVFVDSGGHGTRFTVVLPRTQPVRTGAWIRRQPPCRSFAAPTPPERLVTDSSNGKPTVLVVDDETGILDSLNILLRNEGFTPLLAHGGKRGLEQLRAVTPDIVLTDIRMPNVSGVEILAAARAARSRLSRSSS